MEGCAALRCLSRRDEREHPATALFVAKFIDVLRFEENTVPGGLRSSQLMAGVPCFCRFYPCFLFVLC